MKYPISAITAVLVLLSVICPACAQQKVPDAATDWTKVDGKVPKGTVDPFTVDDHFYNSKRKVWIYTPAGYDAKSTVAYGLIVSFDGEDYIKDIPAPVILDNLIAAKKIAPTIQVFVDNSADRLGDLANHQKFADFVAKDLIPWVRKNYRVTTEPAKTVTCGYSASGLAAAYVAYRHPELFGAVFSQSGAFWRGNEGASSPSEWLTGQYEASPKLNIKFYIVVGGDETTRNASGKSMVETSRHMRDVLIAKGNSVGYLEFPHGNHEPGSWKQELADGLIFLIGSDKK